MDEARRLAMRRAHTRHKGYCTCGKVVSGNGGIFNHRQKHERLQDDHRFMTYTAWCERQAALFPTRATGSVHEEQ